MDSNNAPTVSQPLQIKVDKSIPESQKSPEHVSNLVETDKDKPLKSELADNDSLPPPPVIQDLPIPVIQNPPDLPAANEPPRSESQESKIAIEKKRSDTDEKIAIYKAVAIKLKREQAKSREELQRCREICEDLKGKTESLEQSLELEKQTSITTITTLEATIKSLRMQLESAEADLLSLQSHFESYKIRASKIMQQNNPVNSSKAFEDERYKQLKELNEEQRKHILGLESQLVSSIAKNQEIEIESKLLKEQLESLREEAKLIKILESKSATLCRENENLKLALKQYRSKLMEPNLPSGHQISCEEFHNGVYNTKFEDQPGIDSTDTGATQINIDKQATTEPSVALDDRIEMTPTKLSPYTSVKDDSQTNSSSSCDGSTSGYVHIKPNTFEIISRSSLLEDAQNQIDNLTKAYLDSESTNSLLSEQVKALKEEIRRLQRGTERMDLAENLEYLKNVVFKFLSLDNGQVEQKQRLVPVLSTVLKLSPDETAKLNYIATLDGSSKASSFFKL